MDGGGRHGISNSETYVESSRGPITALENWSLQWCFPTSSEGIEWGSAAISEHLSSSLRPVRSLRTVKRQLLDHQYLLRWPKHKILPVPSASKYAETLKRSDIASGREERCRRSGQIVWRLLRKLSIHFPYHSANSLLGVYPESILQRPTHEYL